jgi:hypothetical protein
VLGYLADKYNLLSKSILNHTVNEALSSKTIEGLKKHDNHYEFKGNKLNQHETDALIIF